MFRQAAINKPKPCDRMTLDVVVLPFRHEGTGVEILGMNEATAMIANKLATHDKEGALERMLED